MKPNSFNITKLLGTFLMVLAGVFLLNTVSAAAINDTFHINLQTTFSNGSIQSGTFTFAFNITENSNSTCLGPLVYNHSTSLTTDSRGIISLYLPTVGSGGGNLSSLSFDKQYYLCYYRDGTLKDVSQLGRVPYSFRATQVNLSEIDIDSNLTLGSFNVSASSGFFTFLGSLVNRITTLFVGNINATGNIQTEGNVTALYYFGNGSQLTNVNSATLDGFDSSFFMPLNTSVTGNFSFNGGWQNGGLSIESGNLFAQTIFVYNITSLNLTKQNLTINDDLLVFGNTDLRKNLTVDSGTFFVNSNNDRVGIGTTTPQNTLNVLGDANITGLLRFGSLPASSINATYIAASAINTTHILDGTILTADIANAQITAALLAASSVNTTHILDGTILAGDIAASAINTTHILDGTVGNIDLANSSLTVTAGSGLTGGGSVSLGSSTTLSVNFGDNFLGWANLTNYPTGCSSGQAVQVIGDTLTCVNLNSTGNVTGTGTANTITKWLTSSTLGNSKITDDGTIVAVDTSDLYINTSSGNVGIGTTSPGAPLSIVKAGAVALTVGRDTTGGSNAMVQINYNSSVDQALAFRNIATNGRIWSIGDGIGTSAGNFGIYDQNAAANRVTIDTAGNVGINTTSPDALLSIFGGETASQTSGLVFFNLTAASNYPALRLDNSAGGSVGDSQGLLINHAGNGNALRVNDDGTLTDSTPFVIDPSGNVGIGTTGPGSALHVVGNVDSEGLTLERTSATTGKYSFGIDTAGNLKISETGVVARLTILKTSGNVGIGTTSPISTLDVNGSSFPVLRVNSEAGGDTTSGAETGIRFRSRNSTGQNQGHADISWTSTGSETGNLVFRVPYTDERMRITSAGNVGIGTTSPLYELDVAKNEGGGVVDSRTYNSNSTDAGSGSRGIIMVNGSSSGDPRLVLSVEAVKEYYVGIDNSDSDKFQIGSGSVPGTTPHLTIDGSGNVGIGTTTPQNKLEVSGGSANISNGFLIIKDGSGSAASLRLDRTTSSSETGLTFNTGGVVDWYFYSNDAGEDLNIQNTGQTGEADATPRIRLSGSNKDVLLALSGGNVGIGTASPSQKLDVAGNIKLGADNSGNYIRYVKDSNGTIINTTRSDNTQVGLLKTNGWGSFSINNGLAVGYDWPESVQSGMIINGNVGIGTVSPGYKLEVSGDIRGDRLVQTSDGNTFLRHLTSEANSWIFQEAVTDWGHFYFNKGTESTKTFGGFGDEGAETFFTRSGTATNAVNLSGYTGVSGTTFATAMVQHTTGNLWVAGDIDVDGGDLLDAGANFFSTSGCGANTGVSSVGSDGLITCTADTGTGTMSSWLLAASGTAGTESITDGETATFTAGNAITSTRATNTVTIGVGNDAIGDTQLAFNTGQHLNTTSTPTFSTVTATTFTGSLSGTATNANDLICTDCIGTTEIGDVYLLNTGDTGGGDYIINGGNPPLTLNSNSQEGLRIDTSDSLGSYVDFRTSNTIRGYIAMGSFIGGTGAPLSDFGIRSEGALVFNSGGQNKRMTIDSTGKVGINTTTPQNTLNVVGAGNVTGILYLGTQGTASGQAIHAGRTLTAGSGLTGGGDLTADRTFNVGAGTCITSNTDDVAVTSNCVDAATTDGFSLNQNVLTTSSPTFAGITSSNSGEQVIIGVDTSNPSIELRDTDGDGLIPFIDFSNDGAIDFDMRLILNGNDQLDISGGNLDLNQNDILDVDKITVTTVDPIYDIEGTKYATYMASMSGGVKEETTGTVNLASPTPPQKGNVKNKTNEYLINFNNLKIGSDLWLFYQITDFGANWEKMQVILTPGFDGRAWYTKDPVAKTLTIYGDSSGEVSYRLTGNRHDWRQWNNLADPNDSSTGMILPFKGK